MTKLTFSTLLLGTIFALPTHAAKLDVSDPETERALRAFIMDNGDLLAESLMKYQRDESIRQMLSVVRDDTPVYGDLESPVTVIEFSDYECPFCKAAQQSVDKLKERYKSRVRFAYKHIPLDFHKNAPDAAKAAMAAQEQGKFWEYSEALFTNQATLNDKLYEELAKQLNLDMKAFNDFRNSDEAQKRLERDMADAQALGVRGTPHFVINGRVISGAQPLPKFVEAVEAALEAAKEGK